MYHFFINKGISLDKLVNLTSSEKIFYIASMSIYKEEEEAHKPKLF